MPAFRLRATLALMAVLGLAACAPGRGNVVAAAPVVSHAAPLSYGTILSMRPVAGANLAANFAKVLGGGIAASSAAAPASVVEFIVQEDDAAQPISVVQPNDADFRAGARVVLSHGDHTRLAALAN